MVEIKKNRFGKVGNLLVSDGALDLLLTSGKTHGTYHEAFRGVAQSGSALDWGSSGRRFKSSRPDQIAQELSLL